MLFGTRYKATQGQCQSRCQKMSRPFTVTIWSSKTTNQPKQRESNNTHHLLLLGRRSRDRTWKYLTWCLVFLRESSAVSEPGCLYTRNTYLRGHGDQVTPAEAHSTWPRKKSGKHLASIQVVNFQQFSRLCSKKRGYVVQVIHEKKTPQMNVSPVRK